MQLILLSEVERMIDMSPRCDSCHKRGMLTDGYCTQCAGLMMTCGKKKIYPRCRPDGRMQCVQCSILIAPDLTEKTVDDEGRCSACVRWNLKMSGDRGDD